MSRIDLHADTYEMLPTLPFGPVKDEQEERLRFLTWSRDYFLRWILRAVEEGSKYWTPTRCKGAFV